MKLGRILLVGLAGVCPALAQNPEVLINAQGLAQQDLSIRGSSYYDSGISINGLNLKVPYSAHFNSELSWYGPLLPNAEPRSGLRNVSGHLVGTAALQIPTFDPQSCISAGLGTDERYQASIFGSTTNIAGFVDWEKARSIDYDANDLERLSSGVFAQFAENDWRFDILSLAQTKEYGAQGYYGIPSVSYAEEHTDDGLIYAGATKGDLDGSYLRAGVAYREFDHEYRLPSISSGFTSDVLSRYGTVMVEGRTLEIQDIALNLRGDLEHERVGGDIGSHRRTRGSVLILPELHRERFTLMAGLNSVFLSNESPEWLPQAGIDYFATDNTKLYGSYAENVQQPDYQTLYYSDYFHAGDSSLSLQRSQNIELGLHQFLSANLDWRIAAFHRRQENAVDWVKTTVPAWTATNLGTMDVTGIDAKISYLSSDQLKLECYYQWITKDEYDLYDGLYELDYPEHLLALSGYWQATPEVQVFGSQVLRYQTNSNIRTGNDFGAEASLGLHYDPRFAKNVRLSFLVENLWDTDFQAIPGLKPRPISFSTGITVNW